MNYFEQELRKIMSATPALKKAKSSYIGRECYVELGGERRARISFSTIRSADNIIVMDDGKVLEQGTHEELLKKGGKYHTMWENYQSSASWKMEKGVGAHA